MSTNTYVSTVLGSVAAAALLYRIFLYRSKTSPLNKEKVLPKVLVLFGSQTGTAESFAWQLAADCRALQLPCEVMALDEAVDSLVAGFPEYTVVLAIASTYGEGDAPDNGAIFDRKLREVAAKTLITGPNSWVGVCGLGSSEYREFNAFGKRLYRGLKQIFAGRVLAELGVCDDCKDTEAAFSAWRLSMWTQVLAKDIGRGPIGVLGAVGDHEGDTDLRLVSAKRKVDLPYDATIINGGGNVVSKFYFTSFGSVRVADWRVIRENEKFVVHVDLDISKIPALRYKTGDTLDVLPVNTPEAVERILEVFGGSDGDKWLQWEKKESADRRIQIRKLFPSPIKLRTALELYCDLHVRPSKSLIRELGKRTEMSESAIDQLLADVQSISKIFTVTDLVVTFFPNVSQYISLEDFLVICPRSRARSYSISSSSTETPTIVGLTVGLENDGLTSGFLCNRITIDQVLGHVNVRQGSFRLPSTMNTPIIMICAGTGIAPFRGFMRELKIRPRPAPKLLFYGLQSAQTDLLYPSDISEFKENGGFVFLAESRPVEAKDRKYVQVEVSDQKSLITALIAKDAHFYVCGSTKMCRGVFEVLSGFEGFLALKEKGKFVEEAWG